MRSNRYFRDGIKSHVVTNPDVVAHRQIPGVSYAHTRTNENAFPDLCAEQDQRQTPPREHVLWRGEHENRLEQPPQLRAPGRATTRGPAKPRQILEPPNFHRDCPAYLHPKQLDRNRRAAFARTHPKSAGRARNVSPQLSFLTAWHHPSTMFSSPVGAAR